MFQFQNGFRTGFTHIFNGILVADVIGTFYRIVHVPFPVIFVGIAQRYRNAALSGYSVRTGWKNFRKQRTGLAALGNL